MDVSVVDANPDSLSSATPLRNVSKVLDEPRDLSEGVVGLGVNGKRELVLSLREALRRHEWLGLRPTRFDHGVLQQPVSQDHLGPSQVDSTVLVAVDHELAEVDDELQAETTDCLTRIAGARRRPGHVEETAGEVELARLHELEDLLAIRERIGPGEAEDCVAFELHESHRRHEP